MTKKEIIKILEDDLEGAQKERDKWIKETTQWNYFHGKARGLISALLKIRQRA